MLPPGAAHEQKLSQSRSYDGLEGRLTPFERVLRAHTPKTVLGLALLKRPSSKLIARLVRQVIPGTEPPHLCLCFWRPHCVLAQEAVITDVSGLSEPQSTLVLEF